MFSRTYRPRRRERSDGSPWWHAGLRRLLTIGLFSVLIGGLLLTVCLKPFYDKAYALDLDDIPKLEAASIVYDRNGTEMSRIYQQNRIPVPLSKVPDFVLKALVSAEDSRFFEHQGVDLIGIARAILLNFRAGKVTQGASTITQQLAKTAFYETASRSVGQKITEAFLARRIEKNLTKDEILENYLNRIFLGHEFYGIEAAAQGYFGKSVDELSVEEAATICGIIKGPNTNSPLRSPERAAKARNMVLDRMVANNYMRPDDGERLKNAPIITNTQTFISRSSYIYDYIRQLVKETVGPDQAAIGGFHVYTTVDVHLQMKAELALRQGLDKVEGRKGYNQPTMGQYVQRRKQAQDKGQSVPDPDYLQGALVAIDNNDGGIVALVGGRNYIHSQYNRATQASRTPGSAFIPFVYADAFSKGLYPGTIVTDKPMDNTFVGVGAVGGLLGEWASETTPSWLGDIPARKALVMSKNAATVRLALRAGLDANNLEPFRDFVKLAGIDSPIREYASSFLGSSTVTLAELTKSYTMFPNLGARPENTYVIRKILNSQGETIFESNAAEAPLLEVTDEFTAYQTHSCLEEVLTNGTASRSYEMGLQKFPSIAGKTGTAYDFKDVCFVGYTDKITCGVWAGFDLPKTIYPGAFSNEITLPIWVDFMNATSRSFPPKAIAPPEGGKLVEICTVSGDLATDACYERSPESTTLSPLYERSAVIELMRPDRHLTGACRVHSPGSEIDDLRRETEDTSGFDSRYGAEGPQPVYVRQPTLRGKDPYNSVEPILAKNAPRAAPTTREGAENESTASPQVEMPVLNPSAQIPIIFPEPINLDDENELTDSSTGR